MSSCPPSLPSAMIENFPGAAENLPGTVEPCSRESSRRIARHVTLRIASARFERSSVVSGKDRHSATHRAARCAAVAAAGRAQGPPRAACRREAAHAPEALHTVPRGNHDADRAPPRSRAASADNGSPRLKETGCTKKWSAHNAMRRGPQRSRAQPPELRRAIGSGAGSNRPARAKMAATPPPFWQRWREACPDEMNRGTGSLRGDSALSFQYLARRPRSGRNPPATGTVTQDHVPRL